MGIQQYYGTLYYYQATEGYIDKDGDRFVLQPRDQLLLLDFSFGLYIRFNISHSEATVT